MLLLSAQNNIYIILSSCVKGHMEKIQAWFFMSLVGFQASKIWIFFGKFTAEQVLKPFAGRDNSLKLTVFGFSDVFCLVLKNQESWELWLDGSWSNSHSEMPTISAKDFFCFSAAIMDLLTALKC